MRFVFLLLSVSSFLFGGSYCLFIDQLALTPDNKQKIYKTLHAIPYPSTVVNDNVVSIYSGHFATQKEAQSLLTTAQREFPKAKVTTCEKSMRYVSGDVAEGFYILRLDSRAMLLPNSVASQTTQQAQRDTHDGYNAPSYAREDDYLHGLYLKANTAYDIQNSDPAYDVRVEYDIFDQGYYQYKKKLQRQQIRDTITFYKTLNTIESISLAQKEMQLQQYENTIWLDGLKLQLKVAKMNYHRAAKQLHDGVITRYQFEQYKLYMHHIEDEVFLYQQKTEAKIPQNLYELFNHIEELKLANRATFLKLFEKNNTNTKLADMLKQQRSLHETWQDNLRVNVYAGARKMYLAQNQTLIGVEAKIPLSSFDEDDEITTRNNLVASQQVTLQKQQLQHNLQNSIANFVYIQHKIRTNQQALKMMQQHLYDLILINNSEAEVYSTKASFEEQQKLQKSYLDLFIQTQLQRVAAYKELETIRSITQVDTITELLTQSEHN